MNGKDARQNSWLMDSFSMKMMMVEMVMNRFELDAVTAQMFDVFPCLGGSPNEPNTHRMKGS